MTEEEAETAKTNILTLIAIILANGPMRFDIGDVVEAGRWDLTVSEDLENDSFVASIREKSGT